MSLKEKTIAGLFWTFFEQLATKGIGFIVQIVLARILLPEEFGLIAMIMVFIGIGNNLVDSGMTQSLIRDIYGNTSVLGMNLLFLKSSRSKMMAKE